MADSSHKGGDMLIKPMQNYSVMANNVLGNGGIFKQNKCDFEEVL